MHEVRARLLVVDHAVAAASGLGDDPGARAVPPPPRRSGRLAADQVIDVLESAGPEALVMARPPWSDASTAPLPALAVVMGIDVLWLPPAIGPAAWACSLVASWARTTPPDDLLRRAQVAVGLAGMSPAALPLREWGPDGTPVPAMGPDAVARWCDCAWCRCDWCGQGGMDGAPCPACTRRPGA